MDGFAGRKSKPQAPDSHRLIPNTDNVHLDAALAGIINRLVTEAIEIERAFELAVDPGQKIEVKGRGDAGRVVVGADQLAGVLFQINADNEPTFWCQQAPHGTEQRSGGKRREIADRRARK